MAAATAPKITISVRVDPENLVNFDKVAAGKKWTRSQAVDEAMAEFVRKHGVPDEEELPAKSGRKGR